mgnify:CR=1 FL=1
MTYKVYVLPEVREEGKMLPNKERQELINLCKELAKDPRPVYAKPILDPYCHNCYRLRKGDFRVVYQIRDKELIVIVAKVGNRKDVYKNLTSLLKRRLSS